MSPTFSRRTLLRQGVGAGAVLLGAPALLAACGGDDSSPGTTVPSTEPAPGPDSTSAPAASADRGSLDFRLSYTPGTGFSGTYLAIDRGFYAAAGFSGVNLIPGGPQATPSAVDVATGKALVGIASTSDQVAVARVNGGAQVKIIGALYQQNPYCVTSLASAPITTATDLVGRTIGVQAANETVWNAFLTASGIDPSDVATVPVQWDPTPLVQGEVDGWFSFVINEPVTLAATGTEVATMMLADFGYPLVAQVYIATDEAIANRRDDLTAVLAAELQGWAVQLADPTAGATLVVEEIAPDLGLDLAIQTEVAKVQNGLILTDDTRRDGLMTMTPELIDGNIATLALGGIEIAAADLFDLSLLDDVYGAHPELIAGLAAVTTGE